MHSTELVASIGNPEQTLRKTANLDVSPTKRFLLPKKKNFEPQYAHVYFSRLKHLSPSVWTTAKKVFGPEKSGKLHYATRIVDISTKDEVETVIVGVVFRQMKSKPSILAQYDLPSHDLIPPPPGRSTASYVGENDTVCVEDEYGRCTLELSELDASEISLSFTTGLVIAMKGVEDRTTGSFKIHAFTPVGPAPQKPLPNLASDTYVCFVSCLSFGMADSDSLPAELLLEFLLGNSGNKEEEEASASIVQLIVVGNLVSNLEETENGATAVLQAHRPVKNGEKERVAGPIYEVDRFLSTVASAMPVAVMPGEADPVNYLMPQQPFHRCLLPSASRNENIHRVTNPFACSLEDRLILGTSGQNVVDFSLYENQNAGASREDPKIYQPSGEKVLQILDLMLRNRHIAPTCPDTLASYPFSGSSDPFVLDQSPHIFFAGSQKEFATRKTALQENVQTENTMDKMDIDGASKNEEVRLISLPRFDKTGWVTLVNLRTLDCVVREFALTM